MNGSKEGKKQRGRKILKWSPFFTEAVTILKLSGWDNFVAQ